MLKPPSVFVFNSNGLNMGMYKMIQVELMQPEIQTGYQDLHLLLFIGIASFGHGMVAFG